MKLLTIHLRFSAKNRLAPQVVPIVQREVSM